MWDVSPSVMQEKQPSGEIPPYVCHHTKVRFWQECFSASPTPLSVVLFIHCCGAGVQPVLRFFSEGTDPHVAVYLLCLSEEVSSDSSYATILIQLPSL